MRVFFRLFRLLLFVPPPLVSFAAVVLGRFFYYCLPIRRGIVRVQMENTLGKELSPREVRRLVRRNYEHYAFLFVESLLLASLDFSRTRYFHEHVEMEGLEEMKAALAQGKGVIGVCAHLGCWEMLGPCCATRIAPVTVVVKYLRNPLVQALREEMQRHEGIRLVDVRAGRERMRALLSALRRGEVTGLFVDQYRHGAERVPFFGYPVRTNPVAAVLAERTGAPVILAYVVRRRFGRYVMVMERLEPPALPEDTPKEERILRLTAFFNGKIEEAIRAHPEQWLWAHTRFRHLPWYDAALPPRSRRSRRRGKEA